MCEEVQIVWEGYITEIYENYFVARMMLISNFITENVDKEEKNFDIPNKHISENDKDQIQLGAIFALKYILENPFMSFHKIVIEFSKQVYTQEDLDIAKKQAEQRLQELKIE